MKRILLNTKQPEERRLAIVEDGMLTGLESEISGQENLKGNIYKGVVSQVEPSLEAAFVDFGEDKNGFLPFKEIHPRYLREEPSANGDTRIAAGEPVVVQVEKNRRGAKGAALTTYLSLAGCSLVLMPNMVGRNRVSRHAEPNIREQARAQLRGMKIPDGMSVIVRTSGLDRGLADWQWDVDSYLLKLWSAIEQATKQDGNFLIYCENNLVVRAIRDYFRDDVDAVVCDDSDTYDEAKRFMEVILPDYADRVRFHESEGEIIAGDIEAQIRRVHEREIGLPSGGRLVFDVTEALVAIDVNSARATQGADIEETALKTNLEAAGESARQLRLRDLSGLIVVDFIDMEEESHRRQVERLFRAELRSDRARVRATDISPFGLMEISRQRLSQSVADTHGVICPRCSGVGRIKTEQACALDLLRAITAQASSPRVAAVYVQAPERVAAYLLNEKRIELRRLEDKHQSGIFILPDAAMQTPDFRIRRMHTESSRDMETLSRPSFEAKEESSDQLRDALSTATATARGPRTPKIKTFIPEDAAPSHQAEKAAEKKGLFAKIAAFFKGDDESQTGKKPQETPRNSRGDSRGRRGASSDGRTSSGRSRYDSSGRTGSGGRSTSSGRPGGRPGNRSSSTNKRAPSGGRGEQQSARTNRPNSGDGRSRPESGGRNERGDSPRRDSRDGGRKQQRGGQRRRPDESAAPRPSAETASGHTPWQEGPVARTESHFAEKPHAAKNPANGGNPPMAKATAEFVAAESSVNSSPPPMRTNPPAVKKPPRDDGLKQVESAVQSRTEKSRDSAVELPSVESWKAEPMRSRGESLSQVETQKSGE